MDYSEADSNTEIRAEFKNTLMSFAPVFQEEEKKGFFLMFKKTMAINNGAERLKMAYISPFEENDGDPENIKNQIAIKKLILENYVHTLTIDEKYWKFQLFNENDHLAVMHWSEYLQKNELIFHEIFATMEPEGLIVNDHKVKKL